MTQRREAARIVAPVQPVNAPSRAAAFLVLLALLPLRVGAQEAAAQPAAASEPRTVAELLERIDRQMTFDTRSARAKMRIVTPGETREKELKIFARGEEDSLILFLEPARDKGTKMLKLEGQLWIYFPRTEKDVKISGHMLRQSLMGSDFSYEDLTENRKLLEDYDGALLPSEEAEGEACWVIHLKEKKPGMSYPERKIWVSKRHELPVREERYAKTGRLLKVLRLSDVRQFDDRWYPMLFVMEDKLKEGTRTEMVMNEVRFKIPVPEEIFDRRNLRREVQF
jgi:outer membrane lipoprotein-sorting protein